MSDKDKILFRYTQQSKASTQITLKIGHCCSTPTYIHTHHYQTVEKIISSNADEDKLVLYNSNIINISTNQRIEMFKTQTLSK